MNEPVPTYLANGTLFYPAGVAECQSRSRQLHIVGLAGRGRSTTPSIVDVRRSFASGFQFRGNYTYSKNLDDGSAWNTSVSGNTPAFVEFPLNPKLDWGPAATDVRQSASLNGSYDLPFGPASPLPQPRCRLRVNFITGGWTASAIVAVANRLPLHPAAWL